jgi:hypothetical protein
MTMTRIAGGWWELRSRYGTPLAFGTLETVITAWPRLRREGWSDVAYGQPVFVNGRRTVECTGCDDCQCRACNDDTSITCVALSTGKASVQPR